LPARAEDISPVREVRETIQDRIGRKYKETFQEKLNNQGKTEKTTLGYQQNVEEKARFNELLK
jgi:hypothetical protein